MFGLNAKQLLLLLLLVAIGYSAVQLIPAYFNALEFNDFIRQEVKYAVAARRTTDIIRTRVVEKSKEYGFNIHPRDVRITRRGPAFTLELDYVIPIDLRFYQRDLRFHVSESGESFD